MFILLFKDEFFGCVYFEVMVSGLFVVVIDDVMRCVLIGNVGIVCDVINVIEYLNVIVVLLSKDWGSMLIE